MNFNINNNLIPIDRFQVLSSSLDSLVKILVKHDFKYSCQEFDNKVLGLVKQKGLYFYEYISSFEKPKQRLPNEKRFYIFLKSKKNVIKSTNRFLRFCKLSNEDDEKLSQLILYVTDVFKNIEIVA